ncbi:MAG: hypothetical protein ACREBW_06660, partial [Candidatus Micrarchaeaceae archaeon]
MQQGRRHFLKEMTGAAGGLASLQAELAMGGTPSASIHATKPKEPSVGDKLWIFAHVAGSNNGLPGLQGTSRMTPAEGAFYLNVPNLIFDAYHDRKEPCKVLPEPAMYDQYGISFLPLQRVVWSIVGDGGHVVQSGLQSVREMAQRFSNITGAYMDDFFRNTLDGREVGVFTPGELTYIQKQLKIDDRTLDLWVTLYHHNLKFDVSGYLARVNVITYWTWKAKDLERLEDGFAQAEQAAPHAKKLLGCYMWDYNGHSPMPMDLMKKQCSLGLEWLKSKR